MAKNGALKIAEMHLKELEDDQEEGFADALEHIEPSSASMDLISSIRETQIALNLFLNNRFTEARARMEPLAKKSMYHALGYATLIYIKAMMTCDTEDIEQAAKATKDACEVCDRFRRQSSLSDQVNRIVKSGDRSDALTDVEMHAELCYAECLLQRALLMFVQDENLVSFVKGALKIRNCYQSYRECQRVLHSSQWSQRDAQVRCHFDSGARLGIGTFNLMISALPSRILRLLEFAGFSGDMQVGMHQLTTGAMNHEYLRAPLCSMVLLSWHLIAVYIVGTGEGDIELCERLLVGLLRNYPKGAMILYFAGRLCIVTAQLERAQDYLQQSIEAQDEWRSFHHVCFWELMFAHAYRRQWSQAAKYAQRLFNENKWSRATYAYMTATFLLAQKVWNLTWDERETMSISFAQVPKLKIRLAGKSLPLEKFCVVKAQRFLRKKDLLLAHYELLYLWNGFHIIGKDCELVKPILEDIDQTLNHHEKLGDLDADDRCLCLLLKAQCLKYLQSPFQAEQCLRQIFLLDKQLRDHLYVAPNAWLELALLKIDEDNIDEARRCLSKAKDYKGYLLESRLHFRVHSLNDKIGTRSPT